MDKLIDDMAWRVRIVLDELEALGWQPVIASSLRSMAEQRRKVAQGYSQTYNSRHLYGRAVDIIDKRYGWAGKASNKQFQFWKDLGRLGEEQGLFWGYRWRSIQDVAHLELKWASKQEKRLDMKRMGVI